MNIYSVAWNYLPESGGSSVSVKNFADAINGCIISFTSSKKIPLLVDEKIVHIPYIEGIFNRYSYTNSKAKKKAENLLRSADLIICHGFYRYHTDWAVCIAKKYGIPYWIIPHGSLDPYVFTYRSSYKKIWLALYGKSIFSSASNIIFSTRSEFKKAAKYVPLNVCKSFYWPISICMNEVTVNRAEIRASLGIPEMGRLLIYMGRIHPMKKPLETISLISEFEKQNIYLLLIGPDSDVMSLNDCKKYAKNIGAKNVFFHTAVYGNARYDYLKAADAFISLSHRENFGYTVAESLSVALPVILSKGNDLSLDVEENSCGWRIKDDDLQSARDTLQDFIETSTYSLHLMGASGQEWVKKKMSVEEFNLNVNNLVKETLNERVQSFF